jgi:Kdo2-lipid IVA lauroyltransferase/acyltransferase
MNRLTHGLLLLLQRLATGGALTRSALIFLLDAFAWRFGIRRRRVARVNLKACFPEATEQQIKGWLRQHFKDYARAFVDRFLLWSEPAERLRDFVQIRGWEYFAAHDGRPVIIFAPHFLGLEAGGMRFQLERRVVNIYSHQSNEALDAWTLQGRRRFNEPILLSRNEGVMPAVRWLKRGVAFHFSPDMDLGQRESIFVPFFGRQAATVPSLVRMARLTGAAVVPLVTRMTSEGYESRFYPAWFHPNNDQEETLAEGVTKMNLFLEARIREMPAQYLWTHRRFKTRPPGEPSLYA